MRNLGNKKKPGTYADRSIRNIRKTISKQKYTAKLKGVKGRTSLCGLRGKKIRGLLGAQLGDS